MGSCTSQSPEAGDGANTQLLDSFAEVKGVPKLSCIPPSETMQKLFEKFKALGTGTTCLVYSAQRTEDGKEFAIKKMPKNKKIHKELFIRETQVLSQLTHPHILSFVFFFCFFCLFVLT